MVNTSGAGPRSVWPRVGSTVFALMVLFLAGLRPEHPDVYVALGRIIIVVAAIALIMRGKDRYNLLERALLIGLGFLWLTNGDHITRSLHMSAVLLIGGGLMLLVSLFCWWIDNYVPDD